ncbi:protein-disulfide reductase DsbD [Shewanella sp. VB17]|uniref:protein-disulfide reductase DsbD n=1 Tax=Shewanella sp. VB17 TaxID=2739432 RepID=UPI0015634017|nr:protein-disulfide reductase DsbD [Shewanella sp. VB17]NRD72424.1 protein-disulfide reductase DsbD [Shewanella sp. VB17]
MKKIIPLILSFVLTSTMLLLTPLAHGEDVFSNSQFNFLKGEPTLMPVDEAFVFEFKQAGNLLKVSWVIADGYYMYRDKLKFEANGAQLNEISLPTGKKHKDEYFGEQEVYYSFIEIPIALKEANDESTVSVTFMGCAEGKLCYPPTKKQILLSKVSPEEDSKNSHIENDSASQPVTQQDSLSQKLTNGSLLGTLIIFFGLGIGLALTPCVFPMYPILSGIIVGQGEKLSTAKAFSLSMVYVQGMAITYSLLGLVVASAGMKYQAALQHPVVLIVLAVLFFVLSLSMFGLYELKLPSSWQEKMNRFSNNQKGGNAAGVFLMGIISGLVASPCTTAPLSGALVYVAQTGDLLQGFLALYVLSMGMGVPLLIIGTSGGKLLPRAGSWMDVIKTVFGFLLIAVSVVMVSRIWPGFISDVLWSIWGIVLVGYLMHQNKLTEFSWKQSTRAVLLTLGLLASFSYGFQAVMTEFGEQSSGQNVPVQQDDHKRIKSLADLNIEVAAAAAQGKPVMLDLYADWCVACKEFEAITFKDPQVQKRLSQIVFLQADVTDNDMVDIELLEHYNVLGLPTLLMFDTSGKLRDELRITGFMKPDPFATHLDLLLNK